jgi:hypothetical protein
LLINACHKGVKGLNRINRLASKADLNDKQQLEEIQAQNDATYEEISADIEFARRTRAKAIAGCVALSKLALVLDNPDLMAGIARSLVKIGRQTATV